jgi:1,4-dihydroxy-6-naphthoate synthase
MRFVATWAAETIREVSNLLKESIQYSLDHREDALEYAMQFAREMDPGLAGPFCRHVGK